MKIPSSYAWLSKIPQLPRTIIEGLNLHGVKETPGNANTPEIMRWLRDLDEGGVTIKGYSADSIAWCGLYAAIVCYRRMRSGPEVVQNPLWARNWANYGTAAESPMLGDVLVFSRGSGGHVGFYIAEDKSCYHVLGGNQGDAVSIVRIQKSRLLAARRPPYAVVPDSVKAYQVEATGKVSTNES